MGHTLDPGSCRISAGKEAHGAIRLHVDDLRMTGDTLFGDLIIKYFHAQFQIGTKDKNDILFVGRRARWTQENHPWHAHLNQSRALADLEEAKIQNKTDSEITPLSGTDHTAFRGILGQIHWLQPRTQFPLRYRFSTSPPEQPLPSRRPLQRRFRRGVPLLSSHICI